MKYAKLAALLVAVLALSFTSTGCRKGPDKLTEIPGQRTPPPSDTAAKPLDDGTPVRNPNVGTEGVTGTGSPTGIAAAPGDFSKYTRDAETFRAEIIYFDFDKSNIKPSEVAKLENIARRMKSEFGGKALSIEGHCDERGTEEYNRALGDRRALSAREYLVRLGLDPNMLPTVSYGKDRPAEPAHNDAAWAKNRRCEFILLTPPKE